MSGTCWPSSLTAARAIDLRPDGPARLGHGTSHAYAEIRTPSYLAHDRPTAPDIEALTRLMRSGALLHAADGAEKVREKVADQPLAHRWL